LGATQVALFFCLNRPNSTSLVPVVIFSSCIITTFKRYTYICCFHLLLCFEERSC
jgi:hypothetical protein